MLRAGRDRPTTRSIATLGDLERVDVSYLLDGDEVFVRDSVTFWYVRMSAIDTLSASVRPTSNSRNAELPGRWILKTLDDLAFALVEPADPSTRAPNARTLEAGDGITFEDGGPGSTLEISAGPAAFQINVLLESMILELQKLRFMIGEMTDVKPSSGDVENSS